MKISLTILVGAIAASACAVPAAYAYNGVITDIRYGEHPYETRTQELRIRIAIANEAKRTGYFVPSNPAYYDPIFARKSVLHPFFRKGGISQYVSGAYAGWRGYIDPVEQQARSVDTYCQNYTYMRTYGGSQSIPQCF